MDCMNMTMNYHPSDQHNAGIPLRRIVGGVSVLLGLLLLAPTSAQAVSKEIDTRINTEQGSFIISAEGPGTLKPGESHAYTITVKRGHYDSSEFHFVGIYSDVNADQEAIARRANCAAQQPLFCLGSSSRSGTGGLSNARLAFRDGAGDYLNTSGSNNIASGSTWTYTIIVSSAVRTDQTISLRYANNDHLRNTGGTFKFFDLTVKVPVPAEPRDLVARGDDEEVTLSWRNPANVAAAGVTAYEYRRSTTRGSFSGSWGSINSGDTISDLDNGTRYYFQVRARTTQGAGTPATVDVVIGPRAKPLFFELPTDMIVSMESTATVVFTSPVRGLSRTAAEYVSNISRENATIISVRNVDQDKIYQGSDAAPVGFNGFTRSYEITFVPSSAGRVRLIIHSNSVSTAAGHPNSVFSASGTARLMPPPGVPASFAAFAGNAAISLTWEPPVSGGVVATYRTECVGLGSGAAQRSTMDVAEFRITHTGLTNAREYRCTVSARNSEGESADAVTTARPLPPVGEHQNGQTYDPRGRRSFTVRGPVTVRPGGTYTYALLKPGGRVETNTQVSVALYSGNANTIALGNVGCGSHFCFSTDSTAGIYTGTDGQADSAGNYLQQDGNTWALTVHVSNDVAAGERVFISMREHATSEGNNLFRMMSLHVQITQPSPPRGLQVLGSSGRATLRWQQPEDDGGKPVRRYEYRSSRTAGNYPPDAVSRWMGIPGGAYIIQHAVPGLENGIRYYFEMRAVNAFGASMSSNEASVVIRTRPELATPFILPEGLVAGEAATATITFRSVVNGLGVNPQDWASDFAGSSNVKINTVRNVDQNKTYNGSGAAPDDYAGETASYVITFTPRSFGTTGVEVSVHGVRSGGLESGPGYFNEIPFNAISHASAPAVPFAPTGLIARTTDDDNISLAWDPSAGGGRVDDYLATCTTTDAAIGPPVVYSRATANTAITLAVAGAGLNQEYRCRVVARNQGGASGDDSTTITPRKTETREGEYGAPDGFTIGVTGPTKVSPDMTRIFEVRKPAGRINANTDVSIGIYSAVPNKVELVDNGCTLTFCMDSNTAATGTSLDLRGGYADAAAQFLQSGGNFWRFTVSIAPDAADGEQFAFAVYESHKSALHHLLTITVEAEPPLAFPVKDPAGGDNQVRLSWGVNNDDRNPITGYEYRQTTTAGSYSRRTSPWIPISNSAAGHRSVTIGGLRNNVLYYYQLRALGVSTGPGTPTGEKSVRVGPRPQHTGGFSFPSGALRAGEEYDATITFAMAVNNLGVSPGELVSDFAGSVNIKVVRIRNNDQGQTYNGLGTQPAGFGSDTTSYTITFTPLAPGSTTLTIARRAVRIGTTSDFYNLQQYVARGTATQANPPAVPTDFVAIPGNGTIALFWEPPTAAGGPPVSYSVQCSSVVKTSETTISATLRTHTFTAINGAAYACSVKAINSGGESPSSVAITVTPRVTAGTNITTNDVTVRGIRINLTGPSTLRPGRIYRYELRKPGGSITNNTSISFAVNKSAENEVGISDADNADDSDGVCHSKFCIRSISTIAGADHRPLQYSDSAGWFLQRGGNYWEFDLSVKNAAVEGDIVHFTVRGPPADDASISNLFTATVQVSRPGMPAKLRGRSINNGVVLTWDAPMDNGGVTSLTYQRQYRLASSTGPWSRGADVSGNRRTVTIAGLVNKRIYAFRVRASTTAGTGAWSSQTEAVAGARPKLTAAASLPDNMATRTAGSVSIAFDAPVSGLGVNPADWRDDFSSSRNMVIDSVENIDQSVTYAGVGDPPEDFDGPTRNYVVHFTPLALGSATLHIRAQGIVANTLFNLEPVVIAGMVSLLGLPGQVTNLVITSANNVLSLVWEAPTTGGVAQRYFAECFIDDNSVASKSVDAPATTTSFTSLTNGEDYECRVTAQNMNGGAVQSSADAAVVRGRPLANIGTSSNAHVSYSYARVELSLNGQTTLEPDSTYTYSITKPGGNIDGNVAFSVGLLSKTANQVGYGNLCGSVFCFQTNAGDRISQVAIPGYPDVAERFLQEGGNSWTLTVYVASTAPPGSTVDLSSRFTGVGRNRAEVKRLLILTVQPQGTDVNAAPFASAGEDQIVLSGATVMLDGSGTDQNGDDLTFAWAHSSTNGVKPGTPVSITNSTEENAFFTAPTASRPTVYEFVLTVADASTSDIDPVTVVVAPNGSIIIPDRKLVFTLAGPARLGPGKNVFNIARTFGRYTTDTAATDQVGVVLSGPFAGPANPPKYSLLVEEKVGNVQFESNGLFGRSAWKAVLKPGAGISEWAVTVEALQGARVGETLEFGLATFQPDRYRVPARSLAYKATVELVAAAGVDQLAASGAAVTLDASDSRGNITGYSWRQTRGSMVTLTGATTATVTFTAPVVSVVTDLVFAVTVTDSTNAIHTDTVTVTVVPSDAIIINESGVAGDQVAVFTLAGPATLIPGTPQTYTLRLIHGSYTRSSLMTEQIGAGIFSDIATDNSKFALTIDPIVVGGLTSLSACGCGAFASVGGLEANDQNTWTLTVTASAMAQVGNRVRLGLATYTPTEQAHTPFLTLTTGVAGANNGPSISGSAVLDYAENGNAAVTTYTASDAEGDGFTWSLSGLDSGLFEIGNNVRDKGELSFRTSPDFEDKARVDSISSVADNTYEVTVTATDDGSPAATSTLPVVVTVTDVSEPGVVTIPGINQLGVTLTATLEEQDAIQGMVIWQWQRGSADGSTYAAITMNADAASYTPTRDDQDRMLRAIASYTDAYGKQTAFGDVPLTLPPPSVKISALDGDSDDVSLDDAKFLYYAYALGPTLNSNAAVRTRALGPLTSTEDGALGGLLTAAKEMLTDLNGDGDTDDEDAAVLYYSFALEGSLGNGGSEPGIPDIKRAILGPLAGTSNMDAINAMLQRVYELREQ